jgi:hypothetical protein
LPTSVRLDNVSKNPFEKSSSFNSLIINDILLLCY